MASWIKPRDVIVEAMLHAQKQPEGLYNRWHDSFPSQNCPSMGKRKTILPKASGEMLNHKGSAHP